MINVGGDDVLVLQGDERTLYDLGFRTAIIRIGTDASDALFT